MASQESARGFSCPESTLESANRRNFIRKAAITTAAASVGSTILGRAIPESSANSAYSYCTLYVKCQVGIGTCSNASGVALCVKANGGNIHASGSIVACYDIKPDKGNSNNGTSQHPGLVFGCGGSAGISSALVSGSHNRYGLDFYTCSAKRMSITESGFVGIGNCSPLAKLCVSGNISAVCPSGAAVGGNGHVGVVGSSGCVAGVGIRGIVTNGCAAGVWGSSCKYVGVKGTGHVPIQALGFCNIDCLEDTKHIQEWAMYYQCSNSTKVLDVVNCKGWLGVGTCTPSSPLCVRGQISGRCPSGIALSGYSTLSAGIGALGYSCCGYGVKGYSNGGVAVLGCAGNSGRAVPIVAQGQICQASDLQKWQILTPGFCCIPPSTTVMSAVNKCGWFGIGRSCAPTTLAVGGSVSAKVAPVTTCYPMSKSDFAIFANASSKAFKVTLPAANTAAGMIVHVKKIDSVSANAVTVEALGKDKIEGKASKSLTTEYASLTLISDGKSPGNWYILSNAT